MVDITAVDESGGALALAPGRTATLEWPESGGEGAGLYRLVATGNWQLVDGPRITNLGGWNYDTPRRYVCLHVHVTPTTAGVFVTAEGPGYVAQGTTDTNGNTTLAVEPGGTVTLTSSGQGAPSRVVQAAPGPGIEFTGTLSCPSSGSSTSETLSIVPQPQTGPGVKYHRLSGLYLRRLAPQ